jgi:prepilin-type N-terminal cleavage/methylation domain-containing protein
MNRLREEDGFALTELLVALVVMGLLMVTSLLVFQAFSNQSRRVDSQSQAQNNARRAIDRMVVQLRSATAGNATGGTPIEKATSNDLVFLVPTQSASLTNNARGVMHTRYCLDTSTSTNGVLYMQTAPYDTATNSAAPSTTACPGTGWTTQAQVADHLVNQLQSPTVSLFTTESDSSGNILDITVRAFVDTNTSTDPRATDLQSSVTLRNLNRQPTADLNCQATSNGHAICDASSSIDADGDNLTYSWTMDGSPLSSTTYRLDQSSLASHSTHSFTVTVTDPGGLTSSATRSITMP